MLISGLQDIDLPLISVMARRCTSSGSSTLLRGARNGATSEEWLCSDVQDIPHWYKTPVQVIPG